jgi:SMODS-associated and fused to various effectors sensor domain/HNH endonuclease
MGAKRVLANPDSPVQQARGVRDNIKFRLIACSAGRCEFRGCNRDLYQHPVTATPGNYSQAAHIIAFRMDGPRGTTSRPFDINAFENLMLLCGDCHHLIDQRPQEFPVALLQTFKREHEERIAAVTALGPELRTTIIQLRGTIGGQAVDIPPTDIQTALQPRYPARLPGVLIDLCGIQRENPAFFALAQEQIRRELRPALRAEREAKQVQHYSVFALAPIPVLVCLGRELGNKLNVDLFQRHRDQSWAWRNAEGVVEYELRQLRTGTEQGCVALQLSLSGQIASMSIPSDIDTKFSLYEIKLRNQPPNVEFLSFRENLVGFRKIYRDTLGQLIAEHGHFDGLHLFLAAPAPVAIACGMDVMPKAHPALIVYDNVKGLFQKAITINTEKDL